MFGEPIRSFGVVAILPSSCYGRDDIGERLTIDL
ncbi:MAG: hypothetical protein ACI8UO_002527 [Verrucomicrobiales bacterium]|jgi:hypothetical protein